jgi:chaperonin GroES
MPVTSEFLLKGAAYALEQCGLLLRDANTLYQGGSYANAVVLTAFAREEFGRSTILLDLRKRALGGETITTEVIKKACDDHETKQKAGMASLTMRADRDSGLGKLLLASLENSPQSAERKEADAKLKQIDETKEKRTPGARHKKRMQALYVEPISEREWNRPANISALAAYEFLVDAVNDYSLRYDQGYTSPSGMLKHLDPELYRSLEEWADRPQLPLPGHPPYPKDQAGTSRMAKSKFRPLHDRVVVKRIEAEEKSAGGIIIPDTAKEKPSQGEIIAVGPGGRDEAGKLVPLDVKAGDRILFGKWSGTEVKIDGVEYLIMKEFDVIGVLA